MCCLPRPFQNIRIWGVCCHGLYEFYGVTGSVKRSLSLQITSTNTIVLYNDQICLDNIITVFTKMSLSDNNAVEITLHLINIYIQFQSAIRLTQCIRNIF